MSHRRGSARTPKRVRVEEFLQADGEESEEEEADDIEAIAESYSEARQATQDIVGRRITPQTRAGYTRTMKFIARFFEQRQILSALKSDGTLKVPVKQNNLELFLSEMSKPFEDSTVRTLSTITGYISSIKFFCAEEDVELSKESYNWISKFIDGYKRVIAGLKDKGVMKNYEGKVPISLNNYAKLCSKALFASQDRSRSSFFVHSFMVLCWNHISCRSTDPSHKLEGRCVGH